jgi:hypothetical protein
MIRRHTVYDLEWIPGTLEVRMVGVYDERGYRWYPDVSTFLNTELTSTNRGRWFYAHAGGLADIQFVLEQILTTKKYQVDAKFSGSSAIIVKIKDSKNCWTFIDSYWLLREKLETIGEWVGIEKGEKEHRRTEEEAREFYTSAPLGVLKAYNETDCVILYTAIGEMQSALLEMGGQLQMTQAASAMNLFRRRFLKRDIETHGFINEQIRSAYFASRVEVFSSKCYDANYYDINSSFPYAMTLPCPGEFLGNLSTLPDYGLYFADVTIDIEESYLPPIPTRIAGRLFFPTGKWRTWLSSVDIELLQRDGSKIRKVHEVYHFAPFDDLKSYAETLYNRRKAAPEGFLKVAYKLLLNSLYGKFAESPFKSSLLIDPDPNRIDYIFDQQLMPGVWLTEREIPVPHMHVPISAHITAVGRRTLFEFLSYCRDSHYCDTDGFSTTETLSTTSELGGLKLEKLIREGTFVLPKLYRLEGLTLVGKEWKDLETETPHQGVKSKGFSRPTVEKFLALQAGKEIEAVRMNRVKEQLRKGDTKPREVTITKRLNLLDAVPKRFTYPDGETRPWHISELKGLK